MRKILSLIFLFGTLICTAETPLVNQEIRYFAKEANEVYLVWGINNWQLLDKKDLPEKSYIKGNLIHTLMSEKENGVFSLDLKLASGTMIDYTFWITKGPHDVPADIWDTNVLPQKDYHTLAMNDNVTQINSKINITPKQQLSILNYAWHLLFIFLIIAIGFFSYLRYKHKELQLNPGPLKIILGSGGIVVTLLFLVRASVTLIGWKLYYNPIEFFPELLIAGYYDHLYMISCALLFVLLLFLFRRSLRIQKILAWVFIAISFISLVAGILNIRVVELIGKSFNFRWLYYSGFLRSSDAKSALASNISVNYVFNIIAVCVAAVIAGIVFIYALEWFLQKVKMRKILLTVFICLNVGYFIIAKNSLSGQNRDYDKLANPVTAFLESVSPFTTTPELYSMQVPDSLNTFGKRKDLKFELPNGYSKKIKNVLIVVLESTPAEYIQPYDSIYRLTPELDKYASNTVVFDNIYAHAPATNKSLVSLLGSVYPWLSYEGITYEHPNINIPTISSYLKDKGYSTAFFNSGDNLFQKTNEFLSYRKFDVVEDCKSLPCKQKFEEKEKKWDPLDGIDDECAADALINWFKKEKNKPFFGMMWTYQTHYPYYASGQKKDYVTYDSVLNRYMNAVNHSDAVIGKILKQLKQSGLSRSTLVVIVGDHGEAFGRHDQITHGFKIYEENVHVPLMFINPSFKRERKNQIGGMVDVAPTIMALIGSEPAEEWQGQNLFTPIKNNRAYFFCPWSDYLYGYREGNKKYIYNASKNTTEIYDLKKDPKETKNIATASEIEMCHQKLAAWVQYQDKFMAAALSPKKNKLISLHKKEH